MDLPATRALGDYGERLAGRYLTDLGYTVLDRNWRRARGEIDLVALDGAWLVVVEVKTRSGGGYGAPFEAVTWRKARRLRTLAGLWLDDHPEHAARRGAVRLDVVSIVAAPGRRPVLEHLRGVS